MTFIPRRPPECWPRRPPECWLRYVAAFFAIGFLAIAMLMNPSVPTTSNSLIPASPTTTSAHTP
eukprot:CAMPEP_0182878388 /NCGR_PEP_ID=MMETSP0034_2-20130328/15324_1 /TAXON_ID=156128 /ORGANISM="Nephroselmis pyriformis, Strain CCMP717" /LENGTH=63 /DNA_ID=CAMNT_0025011271 /DNA_START=64 /DNA_END=251 /DNA_ORIENTATION=-